MPKKAGQTGAEFHELACMNGRSIAVVFGFFLLAGLSAWGLLSKRAAAPAKEDPTDWASDEFDIWEQPAQWPEGLVAADSLVVLTAFTRTEDSTVIWHLGVEPLTVPEGCAVQAWRGGWLIGNRIGSWKDQPGAMAAKWHPRRDGVTRLLRLDNGDIRSSYTPNFDDSPMIHTTWDAPASDAGPRVHLPLEWADWFRRIPEEVPIEHLAIGAYPLERMPARDSLTWIAQSVWLELTLRDGTCLQAFGGVDSTEAVTRGGSWVDGVWYRSTSGSGTPWEALPQCPDRASELQEKEGVNFDFAVMTPTENSRAEHLSDNRLIWHVERGSVRASDGVEVLSENSNAEPLDARRNLLGTARNHRTGESMDLVWEGQHVIAITDGNPVWEWSVETDVAPQIWELDLYRNGKFQVAIGAGKQFDVVDVLGRQVRGFPKSWSNGFSAFAVFDYDRNRQYRILLATPSGELFNFRKEGERTPGWKFKAQSGRHIVALSHLRVGPKDYIFAGQNDGSMRFLKRTGEDRFQSEVVLPIAQTPAFRLGKDIESSTVLYIDKDGWLQEQVLGTEEFTGLSRMTRGRSVQVADLTGDGIPEVVVQTDEGEEWWDARNQRIQIQSVTEN